MLNAVKLSELLTKNVNPQLYPRMFVMSPNGTLLAYSKPVDIKELRDQAALVSMTWKDHEASLQRSTGTDSSELHTLTIETQPNNIIVRAVQPNLLLVLVGTTPPSQKNKFKMTTERAQDSRYPPVEQQALEPPSTSQPKVASSAEESSATAEGEGNAASKQKAPSIASHMSQREKDIKLGALHIQRKKLDAMTDFIRQDFDAKGFVMPDESNFP